MLLPSPPAQAWRCRERGSWDAVGRFGVVHNLVWRDRGSTGVRPQNVGGGSQDPVTRSWECARRGGQTSARKLLPFFPLSVFLRGHILKRLAHTNGLFRVKESGLEAEFFLRPRGPPWWRPIRSGRAGAPAPRGWVSDRALGVGWEVAHGTLRVGERGVHRTSACRLLGEQLQKEGSITVTRLEIFNRLNLSKTQPPLKRGGRGE